MTDTQLQMNEDVEEPPQRKDVLYIFNMSEDVLPFIQSLHPDKQEIEVKENARLAGREYLGGRAAFPGRHVTMVAPFAPDSAYVDFVDDLIDGSGSIEVPNVTHRGSMCDELMQDTALFNRISDNDYRVVSYCNSPQLYRFMEEYKTKDPGITTVDIPSEEAWNVVEPYGTKTGIRRLLTKLNKPEIFMSRGTIHEYFEAAVADAASRPAASGVVVKTHKGHAGMGVAIFRPHTLSEDLEVRQTQIREYLQADNGYWDKFSIVVEDFIETNRTIGGGFPNIEGFIDYTGNVTINYPCGMRIADGAVFAGVELGKDVIDAATTAAMTEIGLEIGRIYSKSGYVGFFELDFLAGVDGRLYVSESNIRRNGGTYAFQLGKYLFGPDFTQRRYLATDIISLQNNSLSFTKIYDATRQLQLQKGSEAGVILTSPDILSMKKLAYLVTAETKELATRIEKEFLAAVEEL